MPRALLLIALSLTIALPLFAQKAVKKGPACPVSGKPSDQNIFTAHKGGRVFFDSDESKQKFMASPAQYTPAANYQLVLTRQAQQVKCPIQGKPLGPTSINVGGIGVCCPNCKAKVASMNQAQRLNLMFGPNFDKLYVVRQSR